MISGRTAERIVFVALLAFFILRSERSVVQQISVQLHQNYEDGGAQHSASNSTSTKNTELSVMNETITKTVDSNTQSKSLQDTILDLFQSLPIASQDHRQTRPLIVQNVLRREPSSSPQDVVLVTQMGVSKFDILLTSLEIWGGPASVGIYMSSKQEIESFFTFVEKHSDALQNSSFHAVLEKKPEDVSNWMYPHNFLRNAAMDSAEADYVLLLDVDFIPSPDSYRQLQNLFSESSRSGDKKDSLAWNMQQKRFVFVFPAFELFPLSGETHARPNTLPKSKGQILQMLKPGSSPRLSTFRHDYVMGHIPTNFPKWLGLARKPVASNRNHTASYYYPIQVNTEKERKFWEPYVLGYRPAMPRYWEEFRGFGRNKLSFANELLVGGFQFAVLEDFWCVHLEHPVVPPAKKEYDEEINVKIYYERFQVYLRGRYGQDITGKTNR
jgi:hypothetical protein